VPDALPAPAITIAILVPASAVLTAVLIKLLKPVLVRYALARPNARSSHTVPTPQGGGIAVLAATLALASAALPAMAPPAPSAELAWLAAAALALGAVGAVDDIWPLPALLRFVLQTIAVTVVVVASGDARILPEVPAWIERGLLVIGGVWFVNLVNFMDGIDWITAAEMVPITAFVALLGAAGLLPLWAAAIGAALCGALLGFAPFNKPAATLFLGDVGSLPIGLLVGWLLLKLAATGALAAAILLPLYYLADATVTLIRRLARGERVWEAHRRHYYQRAIDGNGFTVTAVVAHVFALNLALAALALVAILWPAWPVQAGAVAAGAVLVAALLRRFATPRARPVVTA
jgi:UDP-N-acetylmuramyl pentapeptide phosphotransferase/UDP-N-acetylglucosamine-1-phosphate transferase